VGDRAPRLALVGDYPPPYGGVSVHVRALERGMRARGVDVRVLDIGKGEHRGEGVLPVRAPLPFARELAAAAARGRLLHVHTNGANPKSWLVALAASRARLPGGPRGVLTLHSGLGPAWLEASAERRALARAACAGFGRVVGVNGEIAESLMRLGVPADRIAVLSAFSPAQVAAGAPPPRLAAFRAAHAPLYAVALAHGPTYGEDLVDAALPLVREREPRAGLVAFGPGSAAGPLARRGEAGGVLALGEIPNEEALAVMAASDVFVRPTRADGDAVSVREALAVGRPVVASAVGHRPPGCLLFPAGDARALAAELLAAARLPREAAPLVPGKDPLDALFAMYLTLWGRDSPVTRGPAAHAQRSSSARESALR
jgi:glycosyltransferase involved in cell wall biosynthesis